ncbi:MULTISPECIES: ABC transporter ATP-binding protein [Methanoculleus]|jgi:Fe-S cluster assembly ATP-binding protein|uniref:Iron-regulated ABC transporter ATPase subunit SufC n=1 Tax=Methanoculleus thermophilus TaxID=2200 RepID=A0A1G8WSI4_9EURY|nr:MULTISPECIES: ABC transporter ATP-binding protein [Methanoculleus]NLN09358.1 ABC transporter ATP-binding protein [Methanoculleus thermophilus]SDJ81234.1 Iron-regulated ABC transporter ATPase subunit SufC [Methanoculleus thermophilus]HQD25244.1 ABC transporter ATP-binding protein [Methanoculleus thermophilus]
MLDISNLHVSVDDTEVLHDINLHIGQGETHVLMGPNGSGKSTLLKAIMGFGGYTITEGSIVFKGKDITRMPIHERAHLGIGMMFQHPPAISGLKLGKLLAATSTLGGEAIEALAQSVNMEHFLNRDINVGFSGGEIKRSEVLQLKAQQPDFIMLDEPESGVDLENMNLMGREIATLLEKDVRIVNRRRSGLIITHTGYILDYLDADQGHVLIDGQIRCHGNPREILRVVKDKGYGECLRCKQI